MTILTLSLIATHESFGDKSVSAQSNSPCMHLKPITINYKITDGIVRQTCYQDGLLVVAINATVDGKIMVEIPRKLMDPKNSNCNDEDFSVSINGFNIQDRNVTATQTANVDSRSVTIPFRAGDFQVAIEAWVNPLDKTALQCTILKEHPNGLPPLQQEAIYYTLPVEVSCIDGNVLVKKLNMDSVACVKPQTEKKLVQHGWILVNDIHFVNVYSTSLESEINYTEIGGLIKSCTNAKIGFNYGQGSARIILYNDGNYCQVSIGGEIEMGEFGNECKVPLDYMKNWQSWKSYASTTDISNFCRG